MTIHESPWEKEYLVILYSLGLDMTRDLAAPRTALALLKKHSIIPVTREEFKEALNSTYHGKESVIVVGPGPSSNQLSSPKLGPDFSSSLIIAADGASRMVREAVGRWPDVIVSDLDGISPRMLPNALAEGSLASVHVHGDNLWRFTSLLRALSSRGMRRPPLLVTSQVGDYPPLAFIRGFTDGDRALSLSTYVGRTVLKLVGMDFDLQPVPNDIRGKSTSYLDRVKLAFGRKFAMEVLCHALRARVFERVENLSYFRLECG